MTKKKATKAKPHAKKARPAQKKAAPAKAAPVKAASAKPAQKSVPTAGPKMSLQIYDVQDVPDHQHFYFVNGQRVRNVKELAEIMDRIEQEVFDYHVNAEKNDFYSWVKHVFNDVELAEKLIGVTGPKHLQFTIYKHVADKALRKPKK
jgi:hypothetical protein